MTEQNKQENMENEIAQAGKKVEAANKWRLVFLFIALVILVFLFWGEKLWGGAAWFEAARKKAYLAALVDLTGMVAATFCKLYFAVRYNRLLKKKSITTPGAGIK